LLFLAMGPPARTPGSLMSCIIRELHIRCLAALSATFGRAAGVLWVWFSNLLENRKENGLSSAAPAADFRSSCEEVRL
jgi:hypothetical protein